MQNTIKNTQKKIKNLQIFLANRTGKSPILYTRGTNNDKGSLR